MEDMDEELVAQSRHDAQQRAIAEAAGYARGVEDGKAKIKATVPALLEAAEDQGYARGVEDAAGVSWRSGPFWVMAPTQTAGYFDAANAIAIAIRARLKPKGEAK
jgi:hypothetical protein